MTYDISLRATSPPLPLSHYPAVGLVGYTIHFRISPSCPKDTIHCNTSQFKNTKSASPKDMSPRSEHN